MRVEWMEMRVVWDEEIGWWVGAIRVEKYISSARVCMGGMNVTAVKALDAIWPASARSIEVY